MVVEQSVRHLGEVGLGVVTSYPVSVLGVSCQGHHLTVDTSLGEALSSRCSRMFTDLRYIR